jgi:hypothetical protein
MYSVSSVDNAVSDFKIQKPPATGLFFLPLIVQIIRVFRVICGHFFLCNALLKGFIELAKVELVTRRLCAAIWKSLQENPQSDSLFLL